MVGASGAISALFGLYALFFGGAQAGLPQPEAQPLDPCRMAAGDLGRASMDGGIAGGREGVMLATPAHIGGFIAGLLLQRPLLLWRYRNA